MRLRGDRARRGDGARDDCRRAGAGQAARQGGRGGRQLPRVRRQPDDVPLHVRGAVPRRGRRDAGAGGPARSPTGAWRWASSPWTTWAGSTSPGACARSSNQFSEPGARKPLVADQLVAMNRLGQKTGTGWYRYGDDRKAMPDPEVSTLIERTRRGRGIARRSIHERGDHRAHDLRARSTKARASSRRASRCAPPTSTSST